MRHLRLAITEPCTEDWNSMTGSEKRRHCALCDKHVVALAEMTPEEAEALVRASKPHSLCLRIEHNDDGTVLFREKATANRSMPMLTLAVGASLLAVACDHSTATSPTRDVAKAESTQSVDQKESAKADSTPLADPFNAPIVPTPLTESPGKPASDAENAEDKTTTGTHVQPTKPRNAPNTRITTGCVCAVGDKLCDCL